MLHNLLNKKFLKMNLKISNDEIDETIKILDNNSHKKEVFLLC